MRQGDLIHAVGGMRPRQKKHTESLRTQNIPSTIQQPSYRDQRDTACDETSPMRLFVLARFRRRRRVSGKQSRTALAISNIEAVDRHHAKKD